ncbi:tetratricopeptide repeat protein [Burkholderia glumae]|uniref:tetratricopeptide repeat protein n=1 Tax=Burkholderia glumae TaxID=337 RepID=UPI000C2789F3|nr:tetratricopeptide repeat protein [Burkholderia glumae]MCR1767458.1 sel1 repeat family protein [Burkholderia glumae]PJO21695.1 sel1 repeat family protein [Burkholderia glumae AU6208]QHE10640.1 sel1 repeat family protein [Burkholderia glumae AU6208]QHP91262.1 sel1 repeat family protein [Burkholderia glumae]QJP73069.1 sel1 repeat family protein [Burkholderia glumae]
MNGFAMRARRAAQETPAPRRMGGVLALGLALAWCAANGPAQAADTAAAASASAGRPAAQPARHGKPNAARAITESAVADYNAGDYPAALAGFRRAAARGDRLAQFDYAMMLLKGEGTAANLPDGVRWLTEAARAGMTQAQYVLATMYDDGQFVARDAAAAHGWYLKAARQGNVQAELALANQFLDGRGTPRDNHEAFIWYQRAADAGEPVAQYVTASFYERGGDGVAVNLNIARAYYAAAAAQGDEVAALKYQELSGLLRAQAAASQALGAQPASP